MEEWKRLFRNSVETADELAQYFELSEKEKQEIEAVNEHFSFRINPYYLSLIKEKGDPIWKQAVPNIKELDDHVGVPDPLNEEGDMPVPGITHRYPDRVLFLISHECPIWCRFCTRKRKVGQDSFVTNERIKMGIKYLSEHPEVRDVILSGGDPLVLSNEKLEWILKSVREIPHIEIIRIGSKVPCILPQRITQELCDMLKKYHPLYINTHFNHPRELTPESKKACEMLANAGIPIGNQTVLLKGVNDDPETMKKLVQGLLKMRVRPYYIYQADITKGTDHFRTRVEKGLEIIKALRGFTSGLAVPHFVIDSPGGGGKIPLLPHYIQEINDKEVIMRNYRGDVYRYPQTPKTEEEKKQVQKAVEEFAVDEVY
jgi:lysine 2,3-aminomutase